jgi:ribosomal protein S8
MIRIPNNKKLAENHYEAIKTRLITRIKNILKNGSCIKDKKKKETYNVDDECEVYLTNLIDLIDDKYPKLHSLITCEAQDFENKIKDMDSSFLETNNDSNRILYNIFVSSCYDKKIF